MILNPIGFPDNGHTTPGPGPGKSIILNPIRQNYVVKRRIDDKLGFHRA
jgi:hypothetical protein